MLTDQWENAFQLPTHGSFLIELGTKMWWGDFAVAAPDEVRGQPVQVAGRPAWQFDLTDANQTVSRAAFDAETGVALRWTRPGQTYELTEVEIGVPLADSLFRGP